MDNNTQRNLFYKYLQTQWQGLVFSIQLNLWLKPKQHISLPSFFALVSEILLHTFAVFLVVVEAFWDRWTRR